MMTRGTSARRLIVREGRVDGLSKQAHPVYASAVPVKLFLV